MAGVDPTATIVAGLIAFGIVFAANSAVHSYLILAYSENDKAAMNVGFYYMANAGGRLGGHGALRPALPMGEPGSVPVGLVRLRAWPPPCSP